MEKKHLLCTDVSTMPKKDEYSELSDWVRRAKLCKACPNRNGTTAVKVEDCTVLNNEVRPHIAEQVKKECKDL